MVGVVDGTKRRVQMEVLVYASLLLAVQYVTCSNGYNFCTCSSHAYVDNGPVRWLVLVLV